MNVAVHSPLQAMPWQRTIGAYVNETRYECLRVLRSPALAVPVILVPLAFYLLLGVAMADLRHQGGEHAVSDTMTFVSFAVFGALYPGMGIIGMQLATERAQGLLAYKRALPMPAGSYVVAKLLMALIFGLIVIALLTAMAISFGGVRIQPARIMGLVGVMALGVAPGCAMGLVIAALFPPAAANAVANTAFIAMMNLAGLFFPLPPSLEAAKSIWPAFHLHQLGLAALGDPVQGDAFLHVGMLVAVTAGCSAVAAVLLKRVK